MKLSFPLFFTAFVLQSAAAFVPGSASGDSGLKATVTGLVPPEPTKDLATAELYDSNVQKTYGYVYISVLFNGMKV